MASLEIITNVGLFSYGPVFNPPHPSWTMNVIESERGAPRMMLETTKYIRKPFKIDAVQVTSENMEAVAEWVNGKLTEDEVGKHIKVRVHRPLNDRQTKAYVGDWVLAAGTGYKVYNDSAFKKSFEQTADGSTMVDTSKKSRKKDERGSEVVGVVEGDVVVPKRVPKKAKAAAKSA